MGQAHWVLLKPWRRGAFPARKYAAPGWTLQVADASASSRPGQAAAPDDNVNRRAPLQAGRGTPWSASGETGFPKHSINRGAQHASAAWNPIPDLPDVCPPDV